MFEMNRKEEILKTEKFYADNEDNIVYLDEEDQSNIIWDDFKEAKEMANSGKYHIATVVDEDGDLWIIPDWHIVNRVGYIFFKKKPIGLPEEGILY